MKVKSVLLSSHANIVSIFQAYIYRAGTEEYEEYERFICLQMLSTGDSHCPIIKCKVCKLVSRRKEL
ncbi:hypothetical protein MKW92_047738 [Papaver armeniacum]|nr:hypothetical protein MKW92_047738 [Papaver armeniacum]